MDTLEGMFDAAVKTVRTGTPIAMSDDVRLLYYALYKQATLGDCLIPKPSIFSITQRAKWTAWKDLEGLSQHDAMRRYIQRLDYDLPSWR